MQLRAAVLERREAPEMNPVVALPYSLEGGFQGRSTEREETNSPMVSSSEDKIWSLKGSNR